MNIIAKIKSINFSPVKRYWPFILGAFLVVTVGVGSAWFLSSKILGNRTLGSSAVAPGAANSANEAGILNPNFKYDTATGVLTEGGIGNEGTHHLDRDGLPAHYVYLTSSVIDLQSFVGKKVEVWGETLASKKAGWLMDVAKVQVQP